MTSPKLPSVRELAREFGVPDPETAARETEVRVLREVLQEAWLDDHYGIVYAKGRLEQLGHKFEPDASDFDSGAAESAERGKGEK